MRTRGTGMDFFFEDGVFFYSLSPYANMRDPMKGSILVSMDGL